MGDLLSTAVATAAAVPNPRPFVCRAPEAHAPADLCFEYLFLYNRDVETARWLARVRHDLVKRLVWPARDRRDLGGAPGPGELRAQLVDDEGEPTSAAALRAEGPAGPAVTRFETALERAVAAAAAGQMDGVLALESAFDELAQAMDLARALKEGE